MLGAVAVGQGLLLRRREGRRTGHKVEVVELDLEQLQGDWERWRGTEGQGQGSWPVVGRVEGRRKI